MSRRGKPSKSSARSKRKRAENTVRLIDAREMASVKRHLMDIQASRASAPSSGDDAAAAIRPQRTLTHNRMSRMTSKRPYNGSSSSHKTGKWAPTNRWVDPTWARPPVPPDAAPKDGTTFTMMHMDTTYRMNYNTQRPTIELHGTTEHQNSVVVNVNGFDPHFSVQIPNYPYNDRDAYDPAALVGALKEELKRVIRKEDPKFDMESIPLIRKFKVSQKENVRNFKGLDNAKPFLQIWLTKPGHIPKARKIFESAHLMMDGRRVPRAVTFEANIRYVLRFMVDRKINGCQWITLDNVKVIPKGSGRVSRAQIELQVDASCINPISLDDRPDVAPLVVLSFDIECITHNGDGRFPDPAVDPCIQIAAHVKVMGTPDDQFREYAWTTVPTGTSKEIGPIYGKSGKLAKVYVFYKEAEMLCHWARFMRSVDPDIITGYNIADFDIPFLIGRVETLNIDPSDGLDWSRIIGYKIRPRSHKFSSSAFGSSETFLTSIPGRTTFDAIQWFFREKKYRSYKLNAVADIVLDDRKEDVPYYMIRPLYLRNTEGRRRVLQYCLKDARLPWELLENQMSIVNYIEMVRVTGVPLCWLLERGQMAKTRSRILRAAQDTKPHPFMLPSRAPRPRKYRGAIVVEPDKGYYTDPVIVLDFASLYPSIMIAFNICYTTVFWLDEAGKWGLGPDDYFIPPIDWTVEVDQETNKEVPARNGERRKFAFVKPHIRKGLLPEILSDVLGERKKAKGQKAQADRDGNMTLKYVYDGKQLALKITANSTYGYTSGMMMPDTRLSEAVTSYGRDMITDTTCMIHTRFTTNQYDRGDCDAKGITQEWRDAHVPNEDDTEDMWDINGKVPWECPPTPLDDEDVDPRMVAGVRKYEMTARVIYGDTDSVMVLWKGGTIERALEVGKQMSAYCRNFYKAPNDLELENVYDPFLLLKKKKYAALLWTNPQAYDKLQIKGLEGARRDWTPMTVQLEKDVLKTLMHDKDLEKVKTQIHGVCEKLLSNTMDVSELVITKGYTKTLDEYSKPYPAHIQQVVRMKKRDPTTAPKVGERIASLVIQKAKHASSGDRMEDPIYVMDNNLIIDGMHYIQKQLVGPFVRLLNPVFADNQMEKNDVDGYYEKKTNWNKTTAYKILFTGPHMMKRVQRIPKTAVKGTMTGFLTRQPTCVSCRMPAMRSNADKKTFSAICKSNVCTDKSHDIFVRYCVDLHTKEQRRLGTRKTCVDCQSGMPFEDILCENKSCNNWYARYKARVDYEDAVEQKPRYTDLTPSDFDW